MKPLIVRRSWWAACRMASASSAEQRTSYALPLFAILAPFRFFDMAAI
jgi:hypothetical protein